MKVIELMKNPNINVNTPHGNVQRTPLHAAYYKGHKNIVKHLVENNTSLTATDDNEFTPLHCAAAAGHLQIVSYLIKKGCDTNSLTDERNTCLHILLKLALPSEKLQKVIELLVKAGANLETK